MLEGEERELLEGLTFVGMGLSCIPLYMDTVQHILCGDIICGE